MSFNTLLIPEGAFTRIAGVVLRNGGVSRPATAPRTKHQLRVPLAVQRERLSQPRDVTLIIARPRCQEGTSEQTAELNPGLSKSSECICVNDERLCSVKSGVMRGKWPELLEDNH